MLSVPTDQNEAQRILSSIGRWGSSPETYGMIEWVKSELARLDRLNRRELDNDVMRQRQGACQILEELLEKAEKAAEQAEQIRKFQQRKGA